eukprot:3700752-Pleurochrysis_carterae.AAC.2
MRAARCSGDRLPMPRGSSGEGFLPIPTALRLCLGVVMFAPGVSGVLVFVGLPGHHHSSLP